MPYEAEHRQRTRARIVQSARALFNQRGFDEVSIRDIMTRAGLTHGGFYRHFESKGQLYAEVVSLSYDFASAEARGLIRAYLSRRHLKNVDGGCPLITLPSDVARADPEVKRAFESVFRSMVDCFERELKGGGPRSRPLAIAAICVGAMAVARAVEDRALGDALRVAARECALHLGGWNGARRRTVTSRRTRSTRSTSSRR
ncbi:MAG TPA: TetR/AcrR family transcriptional regulator [Polyangia bacterium]|nr:TetR/AcrR family transcriptional regulator [Polyangia bacterium]